MPEHLDALLKQATVVPAVNQVEVHRYWRGGPELDDVTLEAYGRPIPEA